MKLPVLLLSFAVLLFSLSCVEVRTDIQVTAEPRPEALEGARWAGFPLTYCVAYDPEAFVDEEEFAELVAEAFAVWDMDVRSDGACAGSVTERDGINQVGWGRPPEASAGSHEAGYTRIIFQQCLTPCPGGAATQIIEADIIIAADPPRRWRTSDCLLSVLIHEAGHFLGVPHLDSPALMAPASATCQTDLTPADRLALEQLYGGL